MVVDDDPDLRQTVADILENFGTITQAADGEIAKDLLCRENFNLIITDYKMPNFDGLQLLEFIKEAEIESGVILMSAHMSDKLMILAWAAGGVHFFLRKPFDMDTLIQKALGALKFRMKVMKEVEKAVIEERKRIAKVTFDLAYPPKT